MDAHGFRLVAEEWLRLLSGARVEKIYAPLPDVAALAVFAHGMKIRCLVRWGRKNPLFFLSRESLSNPPVPDAYTMRLRKYVQGKRLGQGIADYAARALAFPVRYENEALWFLISLRDGVRILGDLPDGFGAPPPWPPLSLADTLCGKAWDKKDDTAPWRAFPVLTPLLRETLACLDVMEGRALLADLEAGGGDLFVYANAEGTPALYNAWPLPQGMLEAGKLRPVRDSAAVTARAWPGLSGSFPLLACTSLVDAPCFFSGLDSGATRKEQTAGHREEKRNARLLAKLDGEETRLRGLLALREDACLLQQNLWRFAVDSRLAEVTLPAEEGERAISLNPAVSVRENMGRMFHQSARGARGLAMLETRHAEIRERKGGEALPGKRSGTRGERNRQTGEERAGIHRNIARFHSSDGYALFRGKNAQGNHELVKMARPCDFWLHAADGPSAHLIIRRAHEADDVPNRTLKEAALLVGMKSRQRNESGGEVMVALARHVHTVKGASVGAVRVDNVLRVVWWRFAEGICELPETDH